MVLSQHIFVAFYLQPEKWRSGVCDVPRERHDMRNMYIVALMISGRRS